MQLQNQTSMSADSNDSTNERAMSSSTSDEQPVSVTGCGTCVGGLPHRAKQFWYGMDTTSSTES